MNTTTTEVSEAMVERAVSAALGADIIPIEGGGEGVRIADYLEFPSPGDVVELGVSLGIGDDGKPRFHWLSDVRSDELDDFRRAVLRPIIRAALIAALSPGDGVPGMVLDQDEHHCPICTKAFEPADLCSTDIEMGTCHAACLEGSPTVDLDTGEPMAGPIPTYRYDGEKP